MKQKVEDLIDECTAGTDIFAVKISVSVSNEISLLLDSDSGLTLADCKMVSRHIESNFDREEEDFSLTVASSGLGEPLYVNRQYLKNVGRKVKVKLLEGEVLEGLMTSADDQEIMIEWKSREKKPIGKGKVTVVNKRTIAFSDIKETIVLITF